MEMDKEKLSKELGTHIGRLLKMLTRKYEVQRQINSLKTEEEQLDGAILAEQSIVETLQVVEQTNGFEIIPESMQGQGTAHSAQSRSSAQPPRQARMSTSQNLSKGDSQ